MLDIFFISYDEPNADLNWADLKKRFPCARRIHGVKGIAEAHAAAAKKSNTRMFYVVDADAEIAPDFDFKYKPPEWDSQYVHIWHALNPATGDSYGYGGVKLFAKNFFKQINGYIDFSTSLTSDVKIMPQIACTTRFNSDAIRAFRGAYREAVKLYLTVKTHSDPYIRDEARQRLNKWLSPIQSADYRSAIISGVRSGIKDAAAFGQRNISFINDHDYLVRHIKEKLPEIDLDYSVNLKSTAMKHDLFFSTRIASALYDPAVLSNLRVEELRDAMSDGQLLSKYWLVEQLNNLIVTGAAGEKSNYRVAILGGWIGTLSLMMNSWELPVSITSVDTDRRANQIAKKLNYDFDFTTVDQDMYEHDCSAYDVIINTSSEHIPNIGQWVSTLPPGKLLIVQNCNNDTIADHISCAKNSSQLRNELQLAEVLYEGTKKFPQYSRYMVIGKT